MTNKIIAFYDTQLPDWPLAGTEPAPECEDIDGELRKVQEQLDIFVFVALVDDPPPQSGMDVHFGIPNGMDWHEDGSIEYGGVEYE